MRWVGALEFLGPSNDNRAIWSVAEFPERVTVKPLIVLDPENGVPMTELEGRVEFYQSPTDRGGYKGFVRRSPSLFKRPGDGELITRLLRQAQANPVSRPVDPAKRDYQPLLKAETKKGKRTVQTLVSIPETSEAGGDSTTEDDTGAGPTPHTEIQYRLLRLGTEMGFEVWVARNDRNKTCNGETLRSMPGMVEELPTQFNEATNRTIELIDVLWLKGNSDRGRVRGGMHHVDLFGPAPHERPAGSPTEPEHQPFYRGPRGAEG